MSDERQAGSGAGAAMPSGRNAHEQICSCAYRYYGHTCAVE